MPTTTKPRPAIRLLTKKEVLDLARVTYPCVWKMMRKGKFPRSRQIGTRVVWIEAEVQDWLAALPVQPLKGDKPKHAA